MEKLYNQIVTYLLNVLKTDEIHHHASKNIYSTIIKTQMNINFSVNEKIAEILKSCNELLLQKLWFQVVKRCQIFDILEIFNREINDRDFRDSLWCQDVLNHIMLSPQDISTAGGPSASGENRFLFEKKKYNEKNLNTY